MLSEIIKKRIEEKSGIKVLYSRDCDILANKISSESNCRISASTLRRLFGFVKGTQEARVYTLDVISNYLGYSTWEDLIKPFDPNENISSNSIIELKSNKLKLGEQYEYKFKPNAEVIIEFIGKSRFKVISSKRSQLKNGDIFTASVLTLHHPLFILNVERNGESIDKIIEAKVSGLTAIEKL